jgi:glycosyltransferase involved in cell wall biosynthesis
MTTTSGPEGSERRVLVVEDRAHWPTGHYPNRFAELAEGFVDNGCSVEVLTSQGWLHDGERPVPFAVNHYGWFNRMLCRAGESFSHTRGLRRPAIVARTLGMVRAVRSRCRQAGDPMPDVVVVSIGIDPVVGSAFAKRGRWLFYQFVGPSRVLRGFTSRASRHESRRRAAGGRARIATPGADDCARWEEVAPFLDPVTLSITGVRPRARVADARRRLGLDTQDKVALLFGTAHADKDVDLVARVFAELGDWQLVVAGQVGKNYRPRKGGREAIMIGGYVGSSMRDLVYSAADVVVLSFTPTFQRNSGVLVDAISLGVPVVCSDRSIAADVVRKYNLGVVFEPGNPDSLERTIKLAPAAIDDDDLARARSELSNRAVAARFLAALD